MGLKHPQHYKLMFNSEIVPCHKYADLQSASAITFQTLRKMVEICQTHGIIGKGDSYVIGLHCWSVVNGFTSLYAEERLTWIGVTAQNAEKSLKSLLSQFLTGINKPLENSDFGFKPFETKESAEIKKILDTITKHK